MITNLSSNEWLNATSIPPLIRIFACQLSGNTQKKISTKRKLNHNRCKKDKNNLKWWFDTSWSTSMYNLSTKNLLLTLQHFTRENWKPSLKFLDKIANSLNFHTITIFVHKTCKLCHDAQQFKPQVHPRD